MTDRHLNSNDSTRAAYRKREPQLAKRSRKDFLLAFLYAPGAGGEEQQPIQGITRFEKLVFLVLRDGRFPDLSSAFGFKPDSFGPFSDVLQDELEALTDIGLIKKTPVNAAEMPADELNDAESGEFLARPVPSVFGLTDLGARIARGIWDVMGAAEREDITHVKMEFNRIPLNRLLSHVYLTSSSEWTSKSLIRNKYLH